MVSETSMMARAPATGEALLEGRREGGDGSSESSAQVQPCCWDARDSRGGPPGRKACLAVSLRDPGVGGDRGGKEDGALGQGSGDDQQGTSGERAGKGRPVGRGEVDSETQPQPAI